MRVKLGFCFLPLLVWSAISFAHTPLKSSTPSDNAILKKSPTALILAFREAVTLAKLELTHVDGNDSNKTVPLDFKPSPKAAADYSVSVPALMAGRYRVDWVAIGADTHKIDGSFNFSLQPDADVSVQSANDEQHHH